MKKHTVKYALVTLFALAVLTATTIFLPRPVHGQAGVGPQGKNYQDFRQSYVDFGNGLVINNGVVLGGNVIGQLHTTVSLTAAQIIGMSAAPVQLIAAPGTGHSLTVDRVVFAITRTATAFTGGGVVILQYGNTVTGGGTQALDSTLAATVITGGAGLSNSMRNGAVISDSSATDNAGLFISNQTAAFAAGTGTAVVDIWYELN